MRNTSLFLKVLEDASQPLRTEETSTRFIIPDLQATEVIQSVVKNPKQAEKDLVESSLKLFLEIEGVSKAELLSRLDLSSLLQLRQTNRGIPCTKNKIINQSTW